MEDWMNALVASKVVPVVVLEDASKAVAVAHALLDQGISVAEVTFRTAAAPEAIAKIRAEVPEMMVGAGTVLTIDELHQAQKAGATFCVAPGLDPEVVLEAQRIGMPFVPGFATASELMAAMQLGCKMIKFFPAEAAGGIPLLKSLMAAFGHCGLSIMPTGGVSAETMSDWMSVKGVICVGGSWMMKPILKSLA